MKNKEIDYIILGGGCSALSFALELNNNNIYNYSFLIIESREKYKDDRSWCFWQNNENINRKLISKSWRDFSISFQGKKVIHSSSKYQYHYIRSIDFYNYAIRSIKKSPNINLVLGEKAIKINNLKNKFLVITDKKKYIAKSILDTRPKNNIYINTPFLFQSFLGYEIIANSNKLKQNRANIMENMRYENKKFLFDYILPITKKTFLVEVTSFSKTKVSINTLKDLLEKTLISNQFINYKVKRREYGVIPMGFIKKNTYKNSKNYFYAGSLGGAVRASSGYAFLRIQEWAKESAIYLKKNGKLLSHPKENIIIHSLDKSFLRVLEQNISSAPYIFYVFLNRITTASFIRFMMGKARLIDYLKVILAMPKKYFFSIRF